MKFSFNQHHVLGRPRIETQRLLIVSNGERCHSRRTEKLLKYNDEQNIINGFWDLCEEDSSALTLTLVAYIFTNDWWEIVLCQLSTWNVDSKEFKWWCSYITRGYWVFGLCPLSSILKNTTEYSVSETSYSHVFRVTVTNNTGFRIRRIHLLDAHKSYLQIIIALWILL
jgi:hypothetical protein